MQILMINFINKKLKNKFEKMIKHNIIFLMPIKAMAIIMVMVTIEITIIIIRKHNINSMIKINIAQIFTITIIITLLVITNNSSHINNTSNREIFSKIIIINIFNNKINNNMIMRLRALMNLQ